MDDYLTHLPPAEQDAVRHALEESLSSREQHFSLLHFFDRMQVLEHAGVLRRGEDGRPTHVLGNMEIAEKGKELVPVAGYMAAFLPGRLHPVRPQLRDPPRARTPRSIFRPPRREP